MHKLKNLVQIKSGLYTKTHSRAAVYYLMARDFDDDLKLKPDILPAISDNEKSQKHFLKKGDVLFAAKGHQFFAAVYKERKRPAVASSVFLVLRIIDENRISSDYLAWCLNHPEIQRELHSLARGTNIPSLSKTTFAEFEIPTPHLSLQSKLVKFEKLRQKERALKAQIAQLHNQLIDNQLLQTLNA